MAKQTESKKHAYPKHDTPPPVNIGDAETNDSVQDAESRYSATNDGTKKPPVYKRIAAFIGKKNNQPLIANVVSVFMFGATVWLVIVTLNVFKQTVEQTKQSTKSANAAVSADSLTEIALDRQRSTKEQADIADAKKLKRDTDFINKQMAGIDSQISAIKATQKQFEISHSPYINVIGFGFNRADSLEIDIQNLGTQVAETVEFDFAMKAAKNDDSVFKSFKTAKDWRNWLPIPKRNFSNMQMIIPLAPAVIQEFKSWKSFVSDKDMLLVRQRKKSLYIRVLIYYYNTTNYCKFIYHCQ